MTYCEINKTLLRFQIETERKIGALGICIEIKETADELGIYVGIL